MKHQIDTQARIAAVDAYLAQLWLTPEMITALLCWVGIRPTDPKAGNIRRAVWACAKTTRKLKDTRRNTMFARQMRLQYRLAPGPAKYTKPTVINAASVLVIAGRVEFIHLTELHAPNLQRNRNHNRRTDLRICAEFLQAVASKFRSSVAWKDELVGIDSFARLGLLPEELIEVDAAYRRLTPLVAAVNRKPLVGVALGFSNDYPLYLTHRPGSRKRYRQLTMADFCEIMQKMDEFSGSPEDIATITKLPWSYHDQTLLSAAAALLRPRLC